MLARFVKFFVESHHVPFNQMSLDGDLKYKQETRVNFVCRKLHTFFLSTIASHVQTTSHKSDERTTVEILVQALIIIKKVKQLNVQRTVKPNNSFQIVIVASLLCA